MRAALLLVGPRLGALAAAGERDFRTGRVEAVERPGPQPLLLAEEAAAAYERMNRRDRTDLRAFEVPELERELVGEEIWLGRSRRDLERRLHARDLARLPR